MQLRGQLLESLRNVKSFDKKAFEDVHISGEQVTSIRMNPSKLPMGDYPWPIDNKIPWSEQGYYLEVRPSFTFDPLFHAGCYYVQEASSMFLEQALKQTVDLAKPLRVLDLCAAPGGKSTHIHSLISNDSLLVSNEVIRSRVNTLKDNIIKWGCQNVVVTGNDPADFANLENYFDVIIADAPCSGSGLFRRDPEAINEWSEDNVQLCSQRQQRILADIWPALKKDGILIYSTCSYSKEEDEDIVNWLLNEFAIVHLPLGIDPGWGIVDTGKGCRFWPDKVKGEGFFIACFQKKDGGRNGDFKSRRKANTVSKKEKEILNNWIIDTGHLFIKYENTVYAWPATLADDMNFILTSLRVVYSGVRVGDLIRDKMVPGHALAMSNLVTDSVRLTELDYDQAIHYLQRKDIKIETIRKGWQLVTYQHRPLGWINVLPNRVNNYYPKELRILKETN